MSPVTDMYKKIANCSFLQRPLLLIHFLQYLLHLNLHAASVNHPVPRSRTTVLNNVKAVTKATPQFNLKAKQIKTKLAKTADNFDSGSGRDSDIGLSDEDDSQERKVALKSPEKGAEARKSIKVSQLSPMYSLD